MLKDITFGQYFPFDSFIHKMDPRIKIIMTLWLIVLTFVSFNFISILFMILLVTAIMLISKVPLKFYFKTLKPIIPFVILTAILNTIYIKGDVLFTLFWGWEVTRQGLMTSLFVALRVVMLVMISGALTYTTSPTSLTDAIESLLRPLSKLGIDTHSFAMMMTIALRFIPTLIEETDKIICAQKARGSELEGGKLMEKIRALLPILIPLLASSFRRARELADAMECRCYHGGKGRTRLRVLKMAGRDYGVLASAFCMTAIVILLNIFFGMFGI